MSSDDRTFSVSQIHQARDEAERQLAAIQRRADALRKMAEAAEELEAAERELSSDDTGAVPVAVEQPSPLEPRQTGKRALVIVQSDTSRDWTPRQVWEQAVERRWAEPTKDARAAWRVALTRLEKREERLIRKEAGLTYAYRWVTADSDQPARGSNGRAPTLDWRN